MTTPTDYDKLDSRLTIDVQSVRFADMEPQAFAKAMLLVQRQCVHPDSPYTHATVHCAERDPATGWLEWLVCFRRAVPAEQPQPSLTVALIQRVVGGDWESHS